MKNIKKRVAAFFLAAGLAVLMAFSSLGVVAENPVKLPGDINGDNAFETSDLVVAKKVTLGAATLDSQYFGRADVTGDGEFNIKDIVRMKKMLASVSKAAGGNQENVI